MPPSVSVPFVAAEGHLLGVASESLSLTVMALPFAEENTSAVFSLVV